MRSSCERAEDPVFCGQWYNNQKYNFNTLGATVVVQIGLFIPRQCIVAGKYVSKCGKNIAMVDTQYVTPNSSPRNSVQRWLLTCAMEEFR